jgi:hypothetical protein
MLVKRIRKVEGFFWGGIGFLICLFTWGPDFGSLREPGPSFLAFFTGLFVAGIGMVMAFSEIISKTFQSQTSNIEFSFRNVSWFRLIYTMGLLLGYAFLLNTIGYILTTFLVMLGLLYDWKTNRWGSSFLISIAAAGVTYLVFEIWLHCQFPRGIFPWW